MTVTLQSEKAVGALEVKLLCHRPSRGPSSGAGGCNELSDLLHRRWAGSGGSGDSTFVHT